MAEEIESQLWDRIASLQGSVFRTSGRNGADGVVPGSKKLRTFGASYLYSIFQRLGVIKK